MHRIQGKRYMCFGKFIITLSVGLLCISEIVRNDVNRGLAGAVNLKEVKIRGQYYVISLLQ